MRHHKALKAIKEIYATVGDEQKTIDAILADTRFKEWHNNDFGFVVRTTGSEFEGVIIGRPCPNYQRFIPPVVPVSYHSTIGLNAELPGFARRKLVRIAHERMTDNTWRVYVESGHNLSRIDALGVIELTNDEIQPLFDQNNVQEFRNLAGLFGIEV